MKKYLVVLTLLLLTACTSMPEVTGEAAQVVAEAEQSLQAHNIEEMVYNNGSPTWLLVLLAWCIRTPWGLIADFFKSRKML